MTEHKPLHIAVIIGSTVMFANTMFFAYLGSGLGYEWGIFESTTKNISDIYDLEITPAGWTFSIWGFIYAYQVVFILYSLSLLCRRSGEDGYLYYDPGHIPIASFAFYSLNQGLTLAWVFVNDRQYVIWGCVVLALCAFTLHLTFFFSFRALNTSAGVLMERGQEKEIWLTWLLVHNAWGIYIAWTSIATLLNFGIVLAYPANISMEISCAVCLAILAAELLLFTVMDHTLLDRFTRYLITPYCVVIFALCGSIAKNWDSSKLNSIFSAVLLGVAGLCLLIKIIMVIYRSQKKPLFEIIEEKYGDDVNHYSLQKLHPSKNSVSHGTV